MHLGQLNPPADRSHTPTDRSPSIFLLSTALTYPVTSTGLPVTTSDPRPLVPGSSNPSFERYKLALRQRTCLRTPLLDSVLGELETAARSLKDDLGSFDTRHPSLALVTEVMKEYQPAADSCARTISQAIRERLELEEAKLPLNDGLSST